MTPVLIQAYLNSTFKVVNNSCTGGWSNGTNMASNVRFELFQCCRLVMVHIVLAVTPKEVIQGTKVGGMG